MVFRSVGLFVSIITGLTFPASDIVIADLARRSVCQGEAMHPLAKEINPVSQAAQHSDVLIIGGGVAGLSTAYQLTNRRRSVTLLERQQLGAGSTGQAAGLPPPRGLSRGASSIRLVRVSLTRDPPSSRVTDLVGTNAPSRTGCVEETRERACEQPTP